MDPFTEAMYIQNQGMKAWREGRLDEALELFEKALAKKTELGNKSRPASSIHMLGVVYAQKKDWKNATSYLLKSLQIEANDRNFDGVAVSLNDIGVMCGKQGNEKAELALVKLANLIRQHKERTIKLDKIEVKNLCEKAPPELKKEIKNAIYWLMRWTLISGLLIWIRSRNYL